METVLEKASPKKRFAVAMDAGTTTLAACLVDAKNSSTLGFASMPNPQSKWGSDVLSRINALRGKPILLEKMKRSVVEAFNGLIEKLTDEAGVKKTDISELAIAGNSVMEHIVLGISPEPIGRVPFKPVFKEARRLRARDEGFSAGDAALYVFPLIGGFVGGDAVAVSLFLGLHKTKAVTLAIDIGTNTEIIVSTPAGIFSTSAASGPAFEGGEIKYGMTAEKGAICGVKIENDKIDISVIGAQTPKGLCGSGLVSAISGLLKAGIIEPNGRIKNPEEVETLLSDRIRKDADGNNFILFRNPKGAITLTQSDVRAVQLAKSAIRSGIAVVLDKAGLRTEDVERVFVAGAFGTNIEKEDLVEIGLIEKKWLEHLNAVGNAVLSGVTLALLAEDYKRIAEGLAGDVHYIPLSGSPAFEKEFISNMDFGGRRS